MVHRDGTHVHEFRQIVLVRDIVSMPRNDVKWRVLLCAVEELATKLVHNVPVFLLNLIFCGRMKEVSSVGKAIGA